MSGSGQFHDPGASVTWQSSMVLRLEGFISSAVLTSMVAVEDMIMASWKRLSTKRADSCVPSTVPRWITLRKQRQQWRRFFFNLSGIVPLSDRCRLVSSLLDCTCTGMAYRLRTFDGVAAGCMRPAEQTVSSVFCLGAKR